MPTRISADDLSTRIQELLEERQQHVEAIARVDQTLASVSVALLGATATPHNGTAVGAGTAPASRATGKRRRGRGHFALSAEASILAFVKQRKNPTSGEINAHLKGEGRSASANNALGKLVREKKLKREPLKDRRGSRYLLV